jgi:hypothetical protein
LTGWKAIPPQSWQVKDGVIHGSGRQAFLATDAGDFEDFHLRAEFRINAEGDSGIHFRSPPPDPRNRYGYQIAGLEAEISARKSPNHGTGAVTIKDRPGHVLAPTSMPPHAADEWQTLEIKARGESIEIFLNGQLVTDCRDTERTFRRGHIALASWEDDKIKTAVEFRKVEIRKPAAIDAAPAQASLPPGSSADILTSPEWEWTEPENLGRNVNSSGMDYLPCLSTDGLTLIFASDRPGGRGKDGSLDVYAARARRFLVARGEPDEREFARGRLDGRPVRRWTNAAVHKQPEGRPWRLGPVDHYACVTHGGLVGPRKRRRTTE